MSLLRGGQFSGSSSGGYTSTSSFNSFTASYSGDSASFNLRIISATGSVIDTGSLATISSLNLLSGSFKTDSGSFDSRINSVSSSITGVNYSSFNSYTSSVNTRISDVFASESLYLATASYSVDSSSFNTRIIAATGSSINSGSLTTTSSFYNYTASANIQLSNFFASQSNYVLTSSFVSFSSSLNIQIGNVFSSESRYLLTSSYVIDSSSFNTRILSITGSSVNTGSLATTASLNSFTASYYTDSASFNSRLTGSVSNDISPVLLASGSVSASTNLTISLTAWYNLFSIIEVQYLGFRPVTTNTDLCLRVSADGTTYDSAGSTYDWVNQYGFANNASGSNGVIGDNGNSGDTSIHISQGTDNAAGSHTSGQFRLYNPGNAALKPLIRGDDTTISNATPFTLMHSFAGTRRAAQLTKGVQLFFASGNISSGTYRVYGYV